MPPHTVAATAMRLRRLWFTAHTAAGMLKRGVERREGEPGEQAELDVGQVELAPHRLEQDAHQLPVELIERRHGGQHGEAIDPGLWPDRRRSAGMREFRERRERSLHAFPARRRGATPPQPFRYPAGIGSAVVCLIRSIAKRDVTFFSGIAAISRL